MKEKKQLAKEFIKLIVLSDLIIDTIDNIERQNTDKRLKTSKLYFQYKTQLDDTKNTAENIIDKGFSAKDTTGQFLVEFNIIAKHIERSLQNNIDTALRHTSLLDF